MSDNNHPTRRKLCPWEATGNPVAKVFLRSNHPPSSSSSTSSTSSSSSATVRDSAVGLSSPQTPKAAPALAAVPAAAVAPTPVYPPPRFPIVIRTAQATATNIVPQLRPPCDYSAPRHLRTGGGSSDSGGRGGAITIASYHQNATGATSTSSDSVADVAAPGATLSPPLPTPLAVQQQQKAASSSTASSVSSGYFMPIRKSGLRVETSPGSPLGSTSTDVVPVLLSPVLSRPVRSIPTVSHHAIVRQSAVSDSEPELSNIQSSSSAVAGYRRSRISRPSDSSSSIQTPPRCTSPGQQHLHGNGLGLGYGSQSKNNFDRSDSDSYQPRRRVYSTVDHIRRKTSAGMHSQTSVDSSCSGHNSSGSLVRMRNSSLGHSDPQISAAISTSQLNTSPSSNLHDSAHHHPHQLHHHHHHHHAHHNSVSSSVPCRALGCRRSLNASTSPIMAQRCRSPSRTLLQTTSSNATAKALPQPQAAPTLRSYNTRSGSSLVPAGGHPEHRRWSIASVPSSSGYGTPGSNSALSSEYSSQEQLCDLMNDIRFGGQSGGTIRCDSNDAYDDLGPKTRPRSRSLTSPIRFGSDQSCGVVVRSTVYKERFPKAKQQMEEKLVRFIEENAPLSGISSSSLDISMGAGATPGPSNIAGTGAAIAPVQPQPPSRPISPAISSAQESLNMSNSSSSFSRRSLIVSAGGQAGVDAALLKLIADGATRFIHHQIVEIASDCLNKSRDDVITCAYFCEMSQRLEETLAEAREKTSPEGLTYLSKLVQSLLMIVSRPARLLECLEFNPNEFYHLLEEAEGAVRKQLGSGDARVPDLPQYIISKLGLDREPLCDYDAQHIELERSPTMGSSFEGQLPTGDTVQTWPQETTRPPCEDDYETIRLISNGAYGAVYLVRHRETRHRFALKRMNKQTLILRNQVDQVYAERDILTFTDNPFVVSFYGSFETRNHLCMLMEYVEGGDCAALLKNVGTLPIDLARLYIAETVLAIDYLHSYGIVHRDLKPDNLLITAMGHIKLTDFGLSKIGLMNRTTLVGEGCMLDVADTQQFKDKQLCGTPEYIAPEVILRQGYGKPVDWWALGIIIYEFLIGIVPFLGDTPEQLFANIISEDVEYPEGDEALPLEAESLVTQLLEKNPADRLATVGGAQQVMIQPFFDGLDFKSLLRQKAEFVPHLSSEEDTSYFDTRADRYNHDAESGDDESVAPMFGSFSTASPRHSVIAIEPSSNAATTSSGSGGVILRRDRADSESFFSQQHSSDSFEGLPPDHSSAPECPIPTAVLLRRRFSAQRQNNISSSSSGTVGTAGTGTVNTACSSTDSSMDATSSVFVSGNTDFVNHRSPLPAEGPVKARLNTNAPGSPLPRFAISCEPSDSTSTHIPDKKELSPVEEQKTVGETTGRVSGTASDDGSVSSANEASSAQPQRVILRGGAQAELTPSGSLQLIIPGQTQGVQGTSSSSHQSNTTNQQCSPVGSISSISSQDGAYSPNRSLSLSTSINEPSGPVSPCVSTMKPSIVIKRGPKGFGFTIHSMRVYLGEHSEFYTIEHVVSEVDEHSPAYEAGLRSNDLITHVNSMPVSNLTHPQLMNTLLAYRNELSIKVTPLSATTIREGAARRSIGKLAKRKPKRPQRRVALEKKSRKASSLLRRLSGKRSTNDIVPGSSSQKQTFMPRSVSSQDGIQLSNTASTTPSTVTSTSGVAGPSQQPKVPPDTAAPAEEVCAVVGSTSPLVMPSSTSRPSTLQGLKHKVAGMAHQLTARKQHSTTKMPVSPLARPENASISPTRSPSPLLLGVGACSNNDNNNSNKSNKTNDNNQLSSKPSK